METSPTILSYAGLRERSKMGIDNLSACDTLMQISASMSAYTGADVDLVATQFLEMYLLTFGAAAVIDAKDMPASLGTSDNDGILVCMATRAGTPDANGYGRDLIVSTLDGRVRTIKNFMTDGKDKVVYVKNNSFATPDLTIPQTGDLLREYYESLRHNIVNSRLTPLVVVPNDIVKNAVQKAQKESRLGSYMVVTSDNILDMGGELKILHPTDVKDQDKIQYLNHAYDDIMRHFLNLHGMDISGGAKQAQMSVDEVSSGTNGRKCLPMDMMKARKKGVERIREVFGIDIEVDFSDPWKLEFGLMETPEEKAERGEGDTETAGELNEEKGGDGDGKEIDRLNTDDGNDV